MVIARLKFSCLKFVHGLCADGDRAVVEAAILHLVEEVLAQHEFHDLAGLYPGEFRDWVEHMDLCRCPEGESIAELQQRVLAAVLRICAAHPDGTVAVFTHATPIRTQKCVGNGWPLKKIMTYSWVPNASVSVVTHDADAWKLVLDGYDEHLAGLITELPHEI